jgi:hypothetical protein
MKPTASQEMKRTPRTPKYSLMMSVMMNTTGQSITPAVKDSEPDWPNRRQSNGGRPSVSSSAKIFTPMNSAMSAFVRNSPERTMNTRVERCARLDTAQASRCTVSGENAGRQMAT